MCSCWTWIASSSSPCLAISASCFKDPFDTLPRVQNHQYLIKKSFSQKHIFVQNEANLTANHQLSQQINANAPAYFSKTATHWQGTLTTKITKATPTTKRNKHQQSNETKRNQQHPTSSTTWHQQANINPNTKHKLNINKHETKQNHQATQTKRLFRRRNGPGQSCQLPHEAPRRSTSGESNLSRAPD